MTETTPPIDSILDGTKKALGLGANYDVFDPDIIMHINTAFSTLHQLGIGPAEGFIIEDAAAEWDTFLQGNKHYSSVKSLVYLKVRLLFDPPGVSFVITSIEKQIAELEWRLNTQREGELWERTEAERLLKESAIPLDW